MVMDFSRILLIDLKFVVGEAIAQAKAQHQQRRKNISRHCYHQQTKKG